jgi:hypothetical protein
MPHLLLDNAQPVLAPLRTRLLLPVPRAAVRTPGVRQRLSHLQTAHRQQPDTLLHSQPTHTGLRGPEVLIEEDKGASGAVLLVVEGGALPCVGGGAAAGW